MIAEREVVEIKPVEKAPIAVEERPPLPRAYHNHIGLTNCS
jgi:hypothetical protein